MGPKPQFLSFGGDVGTDTHRVVHRDEGLGRQGAEFDAQRGSLGQVVPNHRAQEVTGEQVRAVPCGEGIELQQRAEPLDLEGVVLVVERQRRDFAASGVPEVLPREISGDPTALFVQLDRAHREFKL